MSVTFYGVSLLEGQELSEANDESLVFDDKTAALKACKKYKGARFKCFADREKAVAFSLSKQTVPTELDASNVKEMPSEKLPFPTPSAKEMLEFRRTIEMSNSDEFIKMIWENPRFLISAGDTPTMIRERYRYHGLLLAVFKRAYSICKALLDAITDATFMSMLYTTDTEDVRKSRMSFLLENYLNTPDKFLNETPLHFASKLGAVDIIQLLVSYPQCDRERLNTRGETPSQIICSDRSCKNLSAEVTEQIRSLLTQRIFIPVLRPADYSSPAQLGRPWTPDITVTSPGTPTDQPESPYSSLASIFTSPTNYSKHLNESQMKLQAFAGPMSPKEAELFYTKMKTPPVPKQLYGHMTPKKMIESRLSDMEKGMERQGRSVAREIKVPWCEYWAFLDEFCDLATEDGLEKLEIYFREQRNNIPEPLTPPSISPVPAVSPLSDLCSQLSRLQLQSPPVTSDDTFFTPPNTPPSTFYEIASFYITGQKPSKIDVDVLRAMDSVEVDFNLYPNVAMWKENMMQQDQDTLSRTRTPASASVSSSSSHNPQSPRLSSITKRLNSPMKSRDILPARLAQRFDDDFEN